MQLYKTCTQHIHKFTTTLHIFTNLYKTSQNFTQKQVQSSTATTSQDFTQLHKTINFYKKKKTYTFHTTIQNSSKPHTTLQHFTQLHMFTKTLQYFTTLHKNNVQNLKKTTFF